MHRHATTSRRITLGLPKSVASSGHSLTRQYASRPPTELKRNGRPERPSELELKRWMKFPERAAQEEKGGWKHTPDRRGEEKRLAAALQTTKPSQYSSSMEKQLFEAELVLDAGEIENDSTFPLGSFVETRRYVFDSSLTFRRKLNNKLQKPSSYDWGFHREHDY